jgi:hypothetical protein
MYPDFQKRKITKIENCYSDVGNLLFGNREFALQGDPKNYSLVWFNAYFTPLFHFVIIQVG